ncbi:hypothetical protein [Intrasporangium mesophilum]
MDSVDGWWGGFGDLMIMVMIGVLLVFGLPAAAVEVWALTRPRQLRWVARTIVVVFVVVAGWLPLLPLGLRFFADQSPVRLQYVTLAVACYSIVMVVQAFGAFAACQWWAARKEKRLQPT